MGNNDIKTLCEILLKEKENFILTERGVKMDFVLKLLGAGTMLSLLVQGTTRMTRSFHLLSEDKNEWKVFNDQYLSNIIKYLEKKKLVEIRIKGSKGVVVLTENGKEKILEMAVDEMVISKPARWDGKWRIVLYDINFDRKGLRDRFQKILKNAGFYQMQESVYVHAYPCEKEIEFMRNYLGLAGEVQLIIASSIENDKQYKDYFDLH